MQFIRIPLVDEFSEASSNLKPAYTSFIFDCNIAQIWECFLKVYAIYSVQSCVCVVQIKDSIYPSLTVILDRYGSVFSKFIAVRVSCVCVLFKLKIQLQSFNFMQIN